MLVLALGPLDEVGQAAEDGGRLLDRVDTTTLASAAGSSQRAPAALDGQRAVQEPAGRDQRSSRVGSGTSPASAR